MRQRTSVGSSAVRSNVMPVETGRIMCPWLRRVRVVLPEADVETHWPRGISGTRCREAGSPAMETLRQQRTSVEVDEGFRRPQASVAVMKCRG